MSDTTDIIAGTAGICVLLLIWAAGILASIAWFVVLPTVGLLYLAGYI